MNHPPKPFTSEWRELHPGQGQSPDDIPSASIDSVFGILLLVFFGCRFAFFKLKKK